MCEQSQGVLNLFRFAEIEAGVEASKIDREPLVGSEQVIARLMQEYECDCVDKPATFKIPNTSRKRLRW
jgi:hypothetical protein